MTATEEMMPSKVLNQISPLPALPKREDKGSSSPVERKSVRAALEAKLGLLLRLVERVKALTHVHVKNVPYLTRSQMVVNVPGPFSLRAPIRSDISAEQKIIEEEADIGEDDAPDDDEEEMQVPEVQDEDISTPVPRLNRERFVVRNEFGHVRIQHLLESIENSAYGMHQPSVAHGSSRSSPGSASAQSPSLQQGFDIGGHCVLPKEVFDLCIEKGWGQSHPMAGRYHPIVMTIIPDTTLMFYAPRNEEELEIVWNIVYKSYEWALSDLKRDA